MMAHRNKICDLSLIFIICCLIVCIFISLSTFKADGNSIRFVRLPGNGRREKRNLRKTLSNPVRESHPFTVRVKRQLKENLENYLLSPTEVRKSESHVQFKRPVTISDSPEQLSEKIPLSPTEVTYSKSKVHFTRPETNGFYGFGKIENSYQSKDQKTLPFKNQYIGLRQQFANPVSKPYRMPQSLADQPQINFNSPTGRAALMCNREMVPFNCCYFPNDCPFYFFPGGSPSITSIDRENPDFISVQPVDSFKDYLVNCPENSYRCTDGKMCVLKSNWCDNVVDCLDASDEIKCSCRERIAKKKICDNSYDCLHGEDELGCFGCPSDSFYCKNNSLQMGAKNTQCIKFQERCDGRRQCTNGEDEKNCNILSLKVAHNDRNEIFRFGHGKGFLYKNLRGTWYPVCHYQYYWAQDACASELGYTDEITPLVMYKKKAEVLGPYLNISGNLVPHCFGQLTYVECPRLVKSTSLVQDDNPIVASIKQNSTKDDPILSIVGGRASLPKAWPSTVGIKRNGIFHCGGVILNKLWILTAAHCFVQSHRYYYEIEAGIQSRSSYSSHLQIRRCIGVRIHENYDSSTMKNDVALLKLEEPLNFTTWVEAVSLPKGDSNTNKITPLPGTMCTVIGWGTTKERGSESEELREVQVPITTCVHKVDRNPAQICAGYMSGGRDACQGDSGGPLMCRKSESSEKQEWYVAGIVSHGVGCARQNEPGVYAKVSHFIPWINKVILQRQGTLSETRATCPGFKCNNPYPRCLPADRRCDLNVHCLGAEDEINCTYPSYS